MKEAGVWEAPGGRYGNEVLELSEVTKDTFQKDRAKKALVDRLGFEALKGILVPDGTDLVWSDDLYDSTTYHQLKKLYRDDAPEIVIDVDDTIEDAVTREIQAVTEGD